MLKAGDKVKFIDGYVFSNGEKVATVSRTELHPFNVGVKVFLEEVDDWFYDRLLVKHETSFEESLKAFEKELILYQQSLENFTKQVQKLNQTLKSL